MFSGLPRVSALRPRGARGCVGTLLINRVTIWDHIAFWELGYPRGYIQDSCLGDLQVLVPPPGQRVARPPATSEASLP